MELPIKSKKIFIRKKNKKSINKIIKKITELPRHKSPLYELNKNLRDMRIIHFENNYIIDEESEHNYIKITNYVNTFFTLFSETETLDRLMNNRKYSKHPKYYNKTRDVIIKKWNKSLSHKTDLENKLHRSIRIYQDTTNIMPAHIAPLEYFFFRRFQKYANKRGWEAYRNDWDIFHEELKLVGRVDMIYKHKNKKEFVLVEWKRNATIVKKSSNKAKAPLNNLEDSEWNRYVIVMNLYKKILETKYNCKIREMLLVNMYAGYPSHTDFHIHSVRSLRKETMKLCLHRLKSLLNKA